MLGLSFDNLYDMTPRSFQNKLIGFKEHNEQLTQNTWEQTRLIIHSCLSPHSKKALKPKELLPFPWDKKTKKVIASKEEIADVVKRHQKILKKLNK